MNNQLAGDKLVAKSALLAEKWHEGQRHSFGEESYFKMHLEPVARIVRRLGYENTFIATAYLHDIKEDTDITDEQLLAEGIPKEIVGAVNLLSKSDDQSHDDYLAGILTSPLAIVVKYCDSSFNFSNTILNSADMSDEDFKRRSSKYAHNIAVLQPKLPKH